MRNPLFDALTADEISRVAKLIRAEGVGGARPGFSAVFADEPDKYRLRAGETVPRRARAMILDRDSGRSINAVVNLETDTLELVEDVPRGLCPCSLRSSNSRRH